MNTTPHGPCKDAFDQWIDGREFPGLNCAPMDSDLYTVFHAGWIAALRSSTGHAVAAANSHWNINVPSGEVIQGVTAEDIYQAYPRHVGKQSALRAIERAVRSGYPSGTSGPIKWAWMLGRTKAYAAAVAKWPAEDRKFIPHPATWFNRGSYDDDPKEWQRGTAIPSQFSKRHE